MSADQVADLLAEVRAVRDDVTEIKVKTAEIPTIKEQVARVEVQATKTNGRVRAIEIWQARMQGATSVFNWVPSAVAAVVGGGIVAALTQLIH